MWHLTAVLHYHKLGFVLACSGAISAQKGLSQAESHDAFVMTCQLCIPWCSACAMSLGAATRLNPSPTSSALVAVCCLTQAFGCAVQAFICTVCSSQQSTKRSA
ncbi:hypothetical protein COO60DRAFT_1118733 [Scenedesmus sp. NREL 46B-D3]|nr:hypothetical protein COO60DRAFT_1118733 [Scenedesmus sp. NREL 46B-D3]